MQRILGTLALVALTTPACSPTTVENVATPAPKPTVAASKALDDALAKLRDTAEIAAVATSTQADPFTTTVRIAGDHSYATVSAKSGTGSMRAEFILIEHTQWTQVPTRSDCWVQTVNDGPYWSIESSNPATALLQRPLAPRWVGGDIEFGVPAATLVGFYPTLRMAFFMDPALVGKDATMLKVRAQIEDGVLTRIVAGPHAIEEIAEAAKDTAAFDAVRGTGIEVTYEQRTEPKRPTAPAASEVCPTA